MVYRNFVVLVIMGLAGLGWNGCIRDHRKAICDRSQARVLSCERVFAIILLGRVARDCRRDKFFCNQEHQASFHAGKQLPARPKLVEFFLHLFYTKDVKRATSSNIFSTSLTLIFVFLIALRFFSIFQTRSARIVTNNSSCGSWGACRRTSS